MFNVAKRKRTGKDRLVKVYSSEEEESSSDSEEESNTRRQELTSDEEKELSSDSEDEECVKRKTSAKQHGKKPLTGGDLDKTPKVEEESKCKERKTKVRRRDPGWSESDGDMDEDCSCGLTPACATREPTEEQTSTDEMRDIIGSFEEASSSSDLPRTSTKSRPSVKTTKRNKKTSKTKTLDGMSDATNGIDSSEFDSNPSKCQPADGQRSLGSVPTKGFIYKYTSPSGKGYVGQSYREGRHRKNEHNSKASGCFAFKHAVSKYGMERMKYEVLLENVPIEDLDRLEDEMMIKHKTLVPHGYNMCRAAQIADKVGKIKNHRLRCAEVMGSERMRQAKSDIWKNEEWKAAALERRREIHGGSEHVNKRRAVFQAKRKTFQATLSEPDRILHAEMARRDAVQGARKTIRKGTYTPDRDPMAEVIEVYGDGSEWKSYKVSHPNEAKAAHRRWQDNRDRVAAENKRKRTAETTAKKATTSAK